MRIPELLIRWGEIPPTKSMNFATIQSHLVYVLALERVDAHILNAVNTTYRYHAAQLSDHTMKRIWVQLDTS